MLGGASAAGEPWEGPVTFAETADGHIVRVVSEAALCGLQAIGADLDAARWRLLGHGSLEHAPGIDHAALTARGFTEHEIGAVEAALPYCLALREAFRPEVVGEGFLADVLGAPGEDLHDPRFDALRVMGFTEAEIAAAQAYALGANRLEGPDLDAAQLRRRLTSTHRLDGLWVERDGRRLLSFSCNDYLNLSHHPAVIEAAAAAVRAYGAGAGASRRVATRAEAPRAGSRATTVWAAPTADTAATRVSMANLSISNPPHQRHSGR